MIKRIQVGNILNCTEDHIAFLVNQERACDTPIIKQIVEKGFYELTDRTYYPMGSVISKTIENKTYYGLVYQSIRMSMKSSIGMIERCLNQIPINQDQDIAFSFATTYQNNIEQIQTEAQQSNKSLVLYK